jgi:hypothetical protein
MGPKESCLTSASQCTNVLHSDLGSWPAESVRGVCHTDDAGVRGGPNPAVLLCLIPSRLGQTGQQASVMGAHAGVVLWLSPRVYARVVGGPLLRL